MTKQVLVSIVGVQKSREGETEVIERKVNGEYAFRNQKHYLIYEETEEGFKQTTKNMMKFADNYMELTKKGVTNVHMLFEKDKKCVTNYVTPYGTFQMEMDGRKIEIMEKEDELQLLVEYGLESEGAFIADCEIKIKITNR